MEVWYDAEEYIDEVERGCYPDVEATKLQCVLLANRLVQELFLLDLPRYTDISEIEVSHLLEMYCRIMDLNSDDFIPSRYQWNTIEQILMSMRDKFGAEQFQHLDSMMIAVGEPSYFHCLLEIFETIVRFQRENGKRYDNLDNLNRTILTDSEMSTVPPPPEENVIKGAPPGVAVSPSASDLELDLVILQDDTGNEEVGLKEIQETSKGYRLEVVIPKMPKSATDGEQTSRSVNNDPGVNSPYDQQFRNITPSDGREKAPLPGAKQPGRKGEMHKSLHSGRENDEVFLPAYKHLGKKKSRTTSDAAVGKQDLPQENKKIQAKAQAKGDKLESISNSDALRIRQDMSNEAELRKARLKKATTKPESGFQPTKDQNVLKKVPSSSKANRNEPNVPMQRRHDEPVRMKDRNQSPSKSATTSTDVDEGDGSPELEGVYRNLQRNLIDQLLQLEEEVDSLKRKQNRDFISSDRKKQGTRSNKVKYDYFGRPIKERFPYYPYGFIRPRCEGSKLPPFCRPKTAQSSNEEKENIDA